MRGMNTDEAWTEAYNWLCKQRRKAPPNSDVWHLRFHWQRDGEAFRSKVERGEYRLKPMRIVSRLADEPIAMWDADDALVLKWVTLQVQNKLPVHPCCHHVKGYGVKYSHRQVIAALDSGEYHFMYRTDIKGYYRHIRKDQLKELIRVWIRDLILRDLIFQYIEYSVEQGGEIHTPTSGICRGCSLSPRIGAALLYHIDSGFAGKEELFYIRYMDDFLILSKTRWGLRRAIKRLYFYLDQGGFDLHPDKTQMGKLVKGFDWLGLWFSPEGITRSPRSIKNHLERCRRLYEQAQFHGMK
ncbi:transposase (plasmid) [Enterobacteriaceae bacterium Kacie_13]|nr:transposase [Enterobacteriaceae bacterium Kacie_13]